MDHNSCQDPWANGVPDPSGHPRIVDLSPWLDGMWDVDESLRRPRDDWAQDVEALVSLIDDLDTPLSFGFDRAKNTLRAEHPDAKWSTEALGAAIKVRRARGSGLVGEVPPRPEYRRSAHDERSRELSPWVNGLKLDAGCADCGYNTHPRALDFDHIRGPKLGNVGAMARAPGMTRERLQAEIDKCEVVCANCHRIRTANRGQY